MEYAEATYYHMGSEEQIEEWLQDRGWQMLVASLDNRPHSPVHYVAVHDERKQLLVCVRGTESISDAVTDMIGARLMRLCRELLCEHAGWSHLRWCFGCGSPE